MNYEEFLERVINEGIAAATEDYSKRPDQKQKLEGSIAGFEACRGKTPTELKEVLDAAHEKQQAALYADNRAEANYWWYRCFEAEVEWVCNVVSAMLHNEGLPTIVPPTARGMMKAATIVGVAGMPE